MARESKSSLTGAVGVILGLAIVGGLAGTPFYLSLLQSDERSLETSAEGDVETIRRVVLSLDQHLASLGDVEAAMPEEDRLTGDEAEQLAAKHEQVLKDKTSGLNQTLQLIRDIEGRDSQRGTLSEGPGAAAAAANPRASLQKLRADYVAANSKLRSQAESSLNALRAMTKGPSVAGALLSVNNASATYYLAVGKMRSNEAAFRQDLVFTLRRQAIGQLDAIVALERSAAALEAQVPAKTREDVKDQIASLQGAITSLETDIGKLESAAAALQDQLADRDDAAAKAREQMAAIEAGGPAALHNQADRYAALSLEARQAEAAAAALRNGTLVGGQAQPQTRGGDSPAYDGGTPQIGLRDLTFRIQQMQERVTTSKETVEKLRQIDKDLSDLADSLEDQRRKLDLAMEPLIDDLRGLLATVDQHAEAADKASAAALAAFRSGAGFSQNALNSANRRKRDAETAARGGSATGNERLELIRKDGDTEAAVQCLAGDIAFNIALLQVRQLTALKEAAATAALTSKYVGSADTADVEKEIDGIRSDAQDRLVSAGKSYEAAEKLLQASSTKTAAGTISGSDYAWQVQIGQAAVQLLQANLKAAAEGVPDHEATDKAYEFLTKAVQGREQSPLLGPALDTLVYLQQTAR